MYRLLTALPLVLLVPACAGGPGGKSGVSRLKDRVEVRYQLPAVGIDQTLVSRNVISADEAYSQRKVEAGFKIAKDEAITVLVKQLRASNFFENAVPAATVEADETITLVTNGRPLTLAKPTGPTRTVEQVRNFIQCKQAFLATFNLSESYSSVGQIDSNQIDGRRRAFQKGKGSIKRVERNDKKRVHSIDWKKGQVEQKGQIPKGKKRP